MSTDEKLSANVLHALDLGVDALRQHIADLEAENHKQAMEITGQDSRINYLERALAESREKFQAEQKARWAAEEHRDKHLENLAKLDRISLALYYYVVELEGFRDTAKTKAERIALGHVVEKLKEIRGWNAAEAEASEARRVKP